jgi:hypothetical protein
MRNLVSLHVLAYLASLAVLVAPVVLMGCEGVTATAGGGGRITVHNTDMGDASNDSTSNGGGEDSPQTPPSDGGAGAYPSSPLCSVCPTGALPDDPITAKQCGIAPDGGTYDAKAGYDNAPLACRVEPSVSMNGQQGTVMSACATVGDGNEGAACHSGSECATSLECVAGGACRHYCCRGDVSCSSDKFCDIQSIAMAAATKVPVCMPLVHPGCALLDDVPNDSMGCPADSTCAVVRGDGTTGCVGVGSAKAGDPCEQDHCGRDLVCLGFGATMRQCYQLCKTDSTYGNQCPQNTTCQATLPLFQDPSVGICQ